MKPEIKYDLSIIPGFSSLVKTKQMDSQFDKYYSIHSYSSKDDPTNYSIVRYNKEMLSSDLVSTYGLLRSVIMINSDKSPHSNIVSFAPPKSLSGSDFMTLYPSKTSTIIAEDFIEGTMINVFYNMHTSSWQIATRNTVGAEVSFYNGSKPFKQMFTEACAHNKFDIRNLNPLFSYSFVLQHPENRIVIPFKHPQLYLVAVYRISQTENGITVYEEDINKVKSSGLQVDTTVQFPVRYEFTSYTELIDKFASSNTPYNIMGIIVKNMETGERTKFRNPIYEEVRHLKGNQPKLQYQYLCLRHSGKLPEFLKYYPETKVQMSQYRDQVHMFTNTLHKNYISCYVKKEKALKEFSDQYRTHMYKIHEQYINELRPKQLYVSNTVVIRYVNSLDPSLLMFCLNYNMRKRIVDTIKSSSHHTVV
jgi:hypothetical protein